MNVEPSARLFMQARPRLVGLAYRMLGSAEEAEDVVQDAFLRWHAADHARIDTPAAWLTKIVTNLCLNRLTSARVQRERYIGPWLPEPARSRFPVDPVQRNMTTREETTRVRAEIAEVLHPQPGQTRAHRRPTVTNCQTVPCSRWRAAA